MGLPRTSFRVRRAGVLGTRSRRRRPSCDSPRLSHITVMPSP